MQLDDLAIELDGANLEIDADRRNVRVGECVVRESGRDMSQKNMKRRGHSMMGVQVQTTATMRIMRCMAQ